MCCRTFLSQFSLKFWVNFAKKKAFLQVYKVQLNFLAQFFLKNRVNFAKKGLTSVQSAAGLFITIFPQNLSQFHPKKDLTSVQSAAGLFSNIFQHNNYVPLYRQ